MFIALVVWGVCAVASADTATTMFSALECMPGSGGDTEIDYWDGNLALNTSTTTNKSVYCPVDLTDGTAYVGGTAYVVDQNNGIDAWCRLGAGDVESQSFSFGSSDSTSSYGSTPQGLALAEVAIASFQYTVMMQCYLPKYGANYSGVRAYYVYESDSPH